jgi:hypothetical protein
LKIGWRDSASLWFSSATKVLSRVDRYRANGLFECPSEIPHEYEKTFGGDCAFAIILGGRGSCEEVNAPMIVTITKMIIGQTYRKLSPPMASTFAKYLAAAFETRGRNCFGNGALEPSTGDPLVLFFEQIWIRLIARTCRPIGGTIG